MKNEGGENDLLDRIAADPAFGLTPAEIAAASDPARFVGRAPEQVDEFLAAEIEPDPRGGPAGGRRRAARGGPGLKRR